MSLLILDSIWSVKITSQEKNVVLMLVLLVCSLVGLCCVVWLHNYFMYVPKYHNHVSASQLFSVQLFCSCFVAFCLPCHCRCLNMWNGSARQVIRVFLVISLLLLLAKAMWCNFKDIKTASQQYVTGKTGIRSWLFLQRKKAL